MIEFALTNYLNDIFQGSPPVYSEIPEDPPAEYIAFERTGGSAENHIESATVAIQSVSTSLEKAIELNDAVKRAMEAFPDIDEVAACYLNSDYNFTDPESERYRYQAVFNITHY